MLYRSLTVAMLCSLVLACAAFAESEPTAKDLPAVVKLNTMPERSVFDTATRRKPIELASAEDAKKHFGEEQHKALGKEVDWAKQKVLIFAWRGSGQDRMEAEVDKGEDGPVVKFIYKPGRTRDLRPHIYVFAVSNDVKWEVK